MEKVFHHIREKQLPCFFLLSVFFSWVVWFVAPVLTEDTGLFNLICFIGFYGPGMAAVVMAAMTGLNAQPMPSLRFWITFAASFIIVFAVNLVSANVMNIALDSDSILIMGLIALPAALILSGPVSKNRGIRRLLRYVKKANVPWRWHVIAFLGVPLLSLAALCIDFLWTKQTLTGFFEPPLFSFIYRRIFVFLAILLYGSGALGQEAGWRGFALHRLLTQYNPLVAGIITGAMWTVWHAPLYANGFYEGGATAFLLRFLWNIPLAIPFTWIYMKTKGSLLHVTLFHASINALGVFVPMTMLSARILVVISVLLTIVVVIENKMWLKRNHLAPFQSKSYWVP